MAAELSSVAGPMGDSGSISFDLTWEPGNHLPELIGPTERWVRFMVGEKKYKGRIAEAKEIASDDREGSTMDVTIDSVREIA